MINDDGSNIREIVEHVIKNMSPGMEPDLRSEILNHVNYYDQDYRNEDARANLYISLKKLMIEKVKQMQNSLKDGMKKSKDESGKKKYL